MKNKQTHRLQTIIIVIIASWLTVFVMVPNLMIVITSFLTYDRHEIVLAQFTWQNYLQMFDQHYVTILFNTLKMASIATLCCLILGYPFAYILTRLPKKMRFACLLLLIIPFWTNSLIRIYGLKAFLNTRGVLNELLLYLGIIDKPLRLLMTQEAMICGLVYTLLPFMILPLFSSLEKLDKNYLEAARDLGANYFGRFFYIILPLTMPGIIAGCLLVILPAMSMFYVADLMGGSKNILIGNEIKTQIQNLNNWPMGSTISICLTLVMAVLLYLYYYTSKSINKKAELE